MGFIIIITLVYARSADIVSGFKNIKMNFIFSNMVSTECPDHVSICSKNSNCNNLSSQHQREKYKEQK